MTTVSHLEVLVEEPSMEAFLRELLPRLLGNQSTFEVYPFQCKNELLERLLQRLKAYRGWLPADWRIVIVVNADNDDCKRLKERLEQNVAAAGLRSRRVAGNTEPWQVVTRIAIEELEAWYFGDWHAVKQCYPRVPASIPNKAAYRDPDAIAGGTWETFERLLQSAGYFVGGLGKIEAARAIGQKLDWQQNHSYSFGIFRDAVLGAIKP